MKRRVDRKPTDPKMLVHVPRRAGEEALKLLTQAFGPHAPEAIKTLVTSLADGIGRHSYVMGRKRKSQFTALLRDHSLTFDTTSPSHVHRIKSGAHNWARYHGCHVATRTHPSGSAVTVYLLKAPA